MSKKEYDPTRSKVDNYVFIVINSTFLKYVKQVNGAARVMPVDNDNDSIQNIVAEQTTEETITNILDELPIKQRAIGLLILQGYTEKEIIKMSGQEKEQITDVFKELRHLLDTI